MRRGSAQVTIKKDVKIPGTDVILEKGDVIEVIKEGQTKGNHEMSKRKLRKNYKSNRGKINERVDEEDRKQALMQNLGIEVSDGGRVEQTRYDDKEFETPEGTYLVLTDEEAFRRFSDITQDFIEEHIVNMADLKVYSDGFYVDEHTQEQIMLNAVDDAMIDLKAKDTTPKEFKYYFDAIPFWIKYSRHLNQPQIIQMLKDKDYDKLYDEILTAFLDMRKKNRIKDYFKYYEYTSEYLLDQNILTPDYEKLEDIIYQEQGRGPTLAEYDLKERVERYSGMYFYIYRQS